MTILTRSAFFTEYIKCPLQMPTSSQALILQVTHGERLPPILPRKHCWEENAGDQAEDNTFQASIDPYVQSSNQPSRMQATQEVPPFTEKYIQTAVEKQIQAFTGASVVQLKDTDHPTANQKKIKSRKKARTRAFGGLPILEYRIDLSSLPQLLKVRGIHGSMGYNKENNTVSWKINSIGPFYDRVNLTPTPSRVMYNRAATLLNPAKPLGMKDSYQRPRFMYTHGDGRGDELSGVTANSDILKPNLLYSRYEIAKDQHRVNLAESEKETGTFFKLAYCDTDSITGQIKYRLQVCPQGESGSFQLMSVDSNGAGDFRLKHPSCAPNSEIRLCRASPHESSFVLLQQNEQQPREFIPIHGAPNFVSSIYDGPMESKHLSSSRKAWDVHIPKHEAFRELSEHSLNMYRPYSGGFLGMDAINAMTLSTDSRGAVFNNFPYASDANYGEIARLPDIFESGEHASILSNKPNADSPNSFSPDRPSPIGRYGVPLKPQHEAAPNEVYMKHLSDECPDVYNKLVSLGFRKAKDQNQKQTDTSVKSKSTKNTFNQASDNAWGSHNFDKWSRTTDAPPRQSSINASGEHTGSLAHPRKGMSDREFTSSEWKTDHFNHWTTTTDHSALIDPGFMTGENM